MFRTLRVSRICYLAGTRAALTKSACYVYFQECCFGACENYTFSHSRCLPELHLFRNWYLANTRELFMKSLFYDHFHKWGSGGRNQIFSQSRKISICYLVGTRASLMKSFFMSIFMNDALVLVEQNIFTC